MKKGLLILLCLPALTFGQVDFKNKIWITYVGSWYETDERDGGLGPNTKWGEDTYTVLAEDTAPPSELLWWMTGLDPEFMEIVELDTSARMIYKTLQETIQALEDHVLVLEDEVSELMGILEASNTCDCQAGFEVTDSIAHWDNGKKQEQGWYYPTEEYYEPTHQWHQNGKLKTIFIYGGCNCNHQLVASVRFGKKGVKVEYE